MEVRHVHLLITLLQVVDLLSQQTDRLALDGEIRSEFCDTSVLQEVLGLALLTLKVVLIAFQMLLSYPLLLDSLLLLYSSKQLLHFKIVLSSDNIRVVIKS